MVRRPYPPGAKKKRGPGKVSEYGKELAEKQKLKKYYGLNEIQFRRYVKNVLQGRGGDTDAALVLISALESRLDNVIFRLGFAPSRPSARQIVSHRHVLVDGKKVNIPSYELKVGQTVSLDAKGMAIPVVAKLLKSEDIKLPAWLEKKAVVGKVARDPKREDITEPISEKDIVEFYSR